MAKINFVYKNQGGLKVGAGEVIRILNDRPHLLLRIVVEGTYFPHRAAEPLVRIVYGEDDYELCWFAEVAEDNKSISAYFPVDARLKGGVEYGYGNVIYDRPEKGVTEEEVIRLDRNKLEKGTIVVNKAYLKEMEK